jgi:hypothetical protein
LTWLRLRAPKKKEKRKPRPAELHIGELTAEKIKNQKIKIKTPPPKKGAFLAPCAQLRRARIRAAILLRRAEPSI